MAQRGNLRARAGRILSSPGLFLSCLAPTLLVGAGLALWLQPEPHSDWAYYWAAAGNASMYERGGLGLWLLAVPKALGLTPVGSALLLNLPCAAAVLWLTWRTDRDGARGLWLACAAYLLLISPYLGLVQLDLLAPLLCALALSFPEASSADGRRPAA